MNSLSGHNDSPDDCQIIFNRVVYGIGESFGHEAVIAEDLRMDPREEREGVNVGKQGIKEVRADSFRLHLVKQAPSVEVFHG